MKKIVSTCVGSGHANNIARVVPATRINMRYRL